MFSQLVINALIVTSIYMIMSIAISFNYSVTHFFHFSLIAVFAFGSYCTFAIHNYIGLPLIVSGIISSLIGGGLGVLKEIIVYRPLRHRGAGPLVCLLASIGVYQVLQNIISILFGDASRSIRQKTVHEGLLVLGARITSVQIVSLVVTFTLISILILVITRTQHGRVIKAVMNDKELANISGMSVDGIILIVSFFSSMLAATGGILRSFDIDMVPTMGMNVLMMGVVVMLVGGINSILGIICGALLLGFAQSFSVWYIGSQWQNTIAFLILILFLIIKPEGFFGKIVKKQAL
jgi:branched-chain amino acid transport system permease protein